MSIHHRPSETLIDLLARRAGELPETRAYTFLEDGEQREHSMTYREFDTRARSIAAHLQTLTHSGDRALLLYPSGLEYIAAFFGCLYAGVVAVPCYPPRRNRPDARLNTLVTDSQASIILTLTPIFSERAAYLAQNPSLRGTTWVATDQLTEDDSHSWRKGNTQADTLAFLQYTSGSTSAPKGVMVTHGNLMTNEGMIQQAFGHTEHSTVVGWLPLFHDMGLIGNVLQPLYVGIPSILMAPEAFLQKPVRWLQAISRYKATSSGGPNFAYELCVENISAEQRAGLDLSSWDVAYNGSESIRAKTLERFTKTFERCGFRHTTFYPCYGLAEATLFVSGGTKKAVPTMLPISSDERPRKDLPPHFRLVGCGHSWDDQHLLIVNPETLTPCQGQEEGEIWLSGPHVASGYWNHAEETDQTFRAFLSDTSEGPFLRTGDLGFLRDGELFITGRLKDLIIIRGQNYYPQDIEQLVECCHPALRHGGGAAFSRERGGEERLVIAQEVKRTALRQLDAETVIEVVRHAVAEHFDIQVETVVLLKPGRVPKTTSGKVQRQLCRKHFLDNDLETVARWQQPERNTQQTPAAEDGDFPSGEGETPDAGTLRSWLLENISQRTGLNAKEIDTQKPLVLYGIDSAMALALSGELSEWLHRQFPPNLAYDYPSIDALAQHIAEELNVAPPVSQDDILAPTGLQRANDTHFPLSYGQQALWLFYQNMPHSAVYNIGGTLRITSPLHVDVFRQSVEFVCRRHSMLHSTFSQHDDTPVYTIYDEREVLIEQLDASDMAEDQLRHYIRGLFMCPFDLIQGPAYRVYLLTRDDHEHIFLFVMHHLVADAWSLEILVTEIFSAYPAFLEGNAPELPAIHTQYQDFVQWQADLLKGKQEDRLWRYWRQQLSGELPVLDLPTDRPYPTRQSYQGGTHAFTLPEDLIARLKTLAHAGETTLYTVLLAAFQIFLHRYSGQDDIVVGSPVTGRSLKEFRPVIGYFANLLALRAKCDGACSFTQFLGRTHRTVRDALAHQDYPFPLLIQRLEAYRDARRFPVCQAAFVFQKEQSSTELLKTLLHTMQHGGLNITNIDLPQQEGLFDLTLEIFDTGTALSAALKYRTDIFDETSIERMSEHFSALLTAIAEEPDQQIGALRFLTEHEQHQIFEEWNDSMMQSSPEGCFHHLFEAQAASTPDNIAVTFEKGRLTYAGLNSRANQVAHYLRDIGVGPDMPVGICIERSFDMIIALLGILKAGGAYLPLDPNLPPDRLAFMLDDAQVPVIITKSYLLEILPQNQAQIVCLDREQSSLARHSRANPLAEVKPEHLAYIIYTSGSTGTPKGVMLEHRGLSHLAQAQIDAFGVRPESHVLQFSSLNFDASISEIAMALGCGAQLCLAPHEALLPGPPLEQLFYEQNITHVTLPPSALTVMSPEQASSVTHLIVAGEACSPELAAQWAEGRRFFNAYGPTETTVCATIYERQAEENPEKLPIGRPMANMQVYLLDRYLQPVPVGITGEIYIGGVGVARGYLNQPELTKERFIPNSLTPSQPSSQAWGFDTMMSPKATDSPPWRGKGWVNTFEDAETPEPTPNPSEEGSSRLRCQKNQTCKPQPCLPGLGAARLYKTGDLARYLPDGNIEFLGRSDQQIKIRGFRIELGEIETAVSAHPAVYDRVVMLRENADGEKQLVAYLASEQPRTTLIPELRQTLRQGLPDYMMPAMFEVLKEFPLTPNGKVDRQALAAYDEERDSQTEWADMPHTVNERILLDIWKQILHHDRLTIHSDFFASGGHSLSAVRLLAALEQRFGRSFSLQSLFEAPTIAEFAGLLEQEAPQTFTPLVALQATDGHPPFFCVHPADGSVFHLSELARKMAGRYTFYGLQAFGLDAQTQALGRIDEMAAAYLRHVRKVFPTGPYVLSGYSSGGVIALEMARQLRQSGELPPPVILLDSVAPHLTAHHELDDSYGLLVLAYMLGNQHDVDLLSAYSQLRGLAFHHDIDIIRQDMRRITPEEGLSILELAARNAGVPFEENTAYLHRMFDVLMANLQAVKQYAVQPYDGRIVLFRSCDPFTGVNHGVPDAHADPTSGWGSYDFPGLEIIEVPGHHFSMLRAPHVEKLADRILTRLR